MTIQQQQHVIKVFETKLETKTKETEALLIFRNQASGIVMLWLASTMPIKSVAELQNAAEQYFAAKHSQALMDLEELQLTLKALKSMQSPIVGATRFR